MKKLLVGLVIVSGFLGSMPVFAGTATDDLNNVYQNTESFDGGPGSTINTSPAAYDASK